MMYLRCELCGCKQLIKKSAFFECTSCNTQYTLEEAQKLLKFDDETIESSMCNDSNDFFIRAGVLEKYNGQSTFVRIPDNVRFLGRNCFTGMTIENVIIPSSLTSIAYAFQNCKQLKSVTISKGITDIRGSFEGCSSLESITIPCTVENMYRAFKNCISLNSIELSDGITDISGAFYGCKSLESIKIPSSVVKIGDAFLYCDSLTSIEILASNVSGYIRIDNCGKLKKINIPNGITEISISNCSSLKSIKLPDSIKHIKGRAFEGNSNLDYVKFPEYWTNGDERTGECVFCGKLFRAEPLFKKRIRQFKCKSCGKVMYNFLK